MAKNGGMKEMGDCRVKKGKFSWMDKKFDDSSGGKKVVGRTCVKNSGFEK